MFSLFFNKFKHIVNKIRTSATLQRADKYHLYRPYRPVLPGPGVTGPTGHLWAANQAQGPLFTATKFWLLGRFQLNLITQLAVSPGYRPYVPGRITRTTTTRWGRSILTSFTTKSRCNTTFTSITNTSAVSLLQVMLPLVQVPTLPGVYGPTVPVRRAVPAACA